LSTLLSIRSGNNLIKTLNKYYSDIWRLHWRRTTTYMIHDWTHRPFGYLEGWVGYFLVNQTKRKGDRKKSPFFISESIF
jgi:hypothetical protein